MDNTDPRYDEWLTAAQYRSAEKQRAKTREKRVETALKVAEGAAPALLPATRSAVQAAARTAQAARAQVARVATARVGVGVGTATLGVGSAAALALLAGTAAYFGTTWLLDKLHKMRDPAERAFQLATAFRNARREAAQRLGRDLSPEEVKYLGAELQAQLVKMGIRK